MALGRYPIPIAQDHEVAYLFQLDPNGDQPRVEGIYKDIEIHILIIYNK
jgi:hypothetical protein